MKPSLMASLSNSRLQNRKERPNPFTNEVDMEFLNVTIFDIFFGKIREVSGKRYQKWILYKIVGVKTVKNVQIEQITKFFE